MMVATCHFHKQQNNKQMSTRIQGGRIYNNMKNTYIEWTKHTFNPWWGCEKVSDACKHCYAEAMAARLGKRVWGKESPRKFMSESHWKGPLKWNREAEKLGERHKVFCASMADVFEDREDLIEERNRLWKLIDETPHLDWQILTKRPENIERMIPWAEWPHNVWLGTTVENQKCAEQRLPHLLKHNAVVRFLSCEPLLEEIDLSKWVNHSKLHPVDWIIAGGESGPKSRPMDPRWAKGLRDFCIEQEIPFFFKQWGNWAPQTLVPSKRRVKMLGDELMVNYGKVQSGRELDGQTWNEFPNHSL